MTRLNVELINEIADIVENLEPNESFDQGTWGTRVTHNDGSCGTSACIAGWATLKLKQMFGVNEVWDKTKDKHVEHMSILGTAEDASYFAIGKKLGFNEYETTIIFGSPSEPATADFFGDYLEDETEAQRAARRLREFACSESLDPDDPALKRNNPEGVGL